MNKEVNKNEDSLKLLCTTLKDKLKKIYLGGGEKKIKDQHAKGKLTARERVEKLIDVESRFLEFGEFAGDGMYEEHGGCPSGGVVTGIGYIEGRSCVIVANDATVKAGAWFPITAKKNLRLCRCVCLTHDTIFTHAMARNFIFFCVSRMLAV